MAIMGMKPTLLLGLMVAALMVVAAAQQLDKKNQGVVTIYNPAELVLDILNNDRTVKVTTQMATLDLTEPQQIISITLGVGTDGFTIEVIIGDTVVVFPDPATAGNVLAFKVVEPQPAFIPKADVRP